MTTKQTFVEYTLELNGIEESGTFEVDINLNNTTGELYIYCPVCRRGIRPHNGECRNEHHVFTITELDVDDIMSQFNDEVLVWYRHKMLLGIW